MKLLDLYCGAGGTAKGYADAGFDVVGVDSEPQPRYPFAFSQDDALFVLRKVLEEGRYRGVTFDVIHASPPCLAHSPVSGFSSGRKWAGTFAKHRDLVPPTRELLRHFAGPTVIEGVPHTPMRRDVVLCGEMFGLRVHRHRAFEVEGAFVMQPPHSRHVRRGAKSNCETGEGIARWITGHYADHEDASDAMGVDWMDRHELRNAVPPAYTEHIGRYLLMALDEAAA